MSVDQVLSQTDIDYINDLVERLPLEDKVRLVSGGSAWATASLPSIGLRAMVLSDGPSGVRGPDWDERDPSLCLPSGTALAASWDVALAESYGAVAAVEARRKGVDVLLGPTVNIHRSPLGGRHFEAFSEDPVLTASLAAAYVEGVQDGGVGATPKHYVANDFETDRFNADVRVSDRALREVYLLAFERAITHAHAWLVMSAYNSVNGVTATENELLHDPLKTTWGFDGVVVSDWTAVRSLESARASQDLAMPGPSDAWGPNLVEAVRRGDVGEVTLDQKVRRILHLAARVGALEGYSPASNVGAEEGEPFARRAAAEGMVLVRNEGLLPLSPTALTRVAVFGESAQRPRIQGGGSATVLPAYSVSPLDGLRAALPPEVVLDYRLGATVAQGFDNFDPDRMTNPETGGPGARVVHYDIDGAPLLSEDRFASLILDCGREEIDGERDWISFSTIYTPAADGELRLGFAAAGTCRLFVDSDLVMETTLTAPPDQVQDFFAPPFETVAVAATSGSPLASRYEFRPSETIIDGIPGSISVSFGTETPPRNSEVEDWLIHDAAQAARAADVAVVVVGTSTSDECEGWDRSDLRLPGSQDQLVAAVAAANPRTIVVVNSGAPVEMPWRNDAAAVLLTWFGGQEYGHALADVLFGLVEPGGRLPTTWPKRLADVPVSAVTPVSGVLSYDEGIHVGYRAWLRAGAEPAYPFGFGLGYTQWSLELVSAIGPNRGGDVEVGVSVTNTGYRPGKQVVQVYIRRQESRVDRPALWLAGFGIVRLDPGHSERLRIQVPLRAFAHWDDGWDLERGKYEFLVGTSVEQLLPPVAVHLEGSGVGEPFSHEAQ